MKAILAIFAIGFVAVALADLSEDQKKKLAQHKKACMEESVPDMSILEKLSTGEKVEFDEKTSCFMTCVLKKTEIMKADGSVNEEVARAKAPKDMSKEKLDEVIKTCSSVEGKSSCEKGRNMMICMMKYKVFAL